MSEEEQCNQCGKMGHFMPGGNPKPGESDNSNALIDCIVRYMGASVNLYGSLQYLEEYNTLVSELIKRGRLKVT